MREYGQGHPSWINKYILIVINTLPHTLIEFKVQIIHQVDNPSSKSSSVAVYIKAIDRANASRRNEISINLHISSNFNFAPSA